MHALHPRTPLKKKKKANKTAKTEKMLSDWWAASLCPDVYYVSIILDPQEDPVVELCRDWAKEQSLNTLEVSSSVFLWHRNCCFTYFYSVKYSYSNLIMCIITDVCNSLAGEILRINLSLAHAWFKRTFKKKKKKRTSVTTLGTFLSRNFSPKKSNSVIIGEFIPERAYVKYVRLFKRDPLFFGVDHWLEEF